MPIFARIVAVLGILISLNLAFITSDVHADGEFETDYAVVYAIDNNGLATATYNITLKNKTPNYYADKFELKIGTTKVTEVAARDSTGDLQTEVRFENNITTISTKFNQKVIGLGKSLSWTLVYRSTEIASKSGQIWEISIPKVANSADTGSYDLEVLVPKALGPNAFAIPEPKEKTETTQDFLLKFDKDQLTKNGVALGFGEKQVFSLNLAYNLENPNITSQILEIALPPDNNYQKIVLTNIEPTPLDITVDSDGNFLAKYKLKPKQKINVTVTGYVEVFTAPFRKIQKTLSEQEKERYTLPQSYWEVDNTQIREKAQELKTTQNIYDYLTKSFKYNSERLTSGSLVRKGALSALNNSDDLVCTEFTDLFIALARAAGIPAREIEGYAYTQNERLRPLSLNLYENDLLHAWPEYWDDEKGWVQIDPTWATTSGGLDYFHKMDFNHIAFVHRGVASTEPLPVGAYKTEETKTQKSVYVQFAQDLPDTTPGVDIEFDVPKRAISSLPLKFKLTVKNTASTSIISETLVLDAQHLGLIPKKEQNIDILPPFSKKAYEFSFPTKGFLNTIIVVLSATYAGTTEVLNVEIEPFYMLFTDIVFLLTTASIISFVVLGLKLYKKHHITKKI